MSNPFHDEIAEQALEALKDADPAQAITRLRGILAEAPDRVDVLHAIAVSELKRGEPRAALEASYEAEAVARQRADEAAGQLMAPIFQVRGAACEDLYDAAGAEAAYREVLRHEPDNPRIRQALGYLLLSWGRTAEGLDELKGYLRDRTDEEAYLEATAQLVTAVERFVADDVHPRVFVEAHRGSYVEFFDHHARNMEKQGWIAEAARMHRDDNGQVVPIIPDGARPYAGTRVDLVDPKTGQLGRIGDQPMIVAVSGYEPLAQAAVLFDWPDRDVPFALWVSSQVPWNHFSVQVRFRPEVQHPLETLDLTVGDWYAAGFEGDFGAKDAGRFHEITDPEEHAGGQVLYWVDCGRAEDRAVRDLLRRLTALHQQHPIAQVVLGRGYLPPLSG